MIWTLSAKRIDDRTCEHTNSVVAHPTAEFTEFIAAHNISFEDALPPGSMTVWIPTAGRRHFSQEASSVRR